MKGRPVREAINLLLFACLSGLFLVHPHTAGMAWSRVVLDSLLTAPIALAIFAHSKLPPSVLLSYGALGAIAVTLTWTPLSLSGPAWLLPSFYIAFFGLSTVIYGGDVFHADEVDAHTLVGAANTYVFLGLTFASAFALLICFDEGAVSLPVNSTEPLADLTYFSFVTLTTLGYGDVLPGSHAARMLAAYEAIVGQLYVAVAVAVLVGRHVAGLSTKH